MLPRILDVPRRNFHGIFLWSCTHVTVGLMQMRGANQPNEKSDSADSNEDNPCSIAEVAETDLERGPGHGRKTYTNVESFINVTR